MVSFKRLYLKILLRMYAHLSQVSLSELYDFISSNFMIGSFVKHSTNYNGYVTSLLREFISGIL